MFSSDPRTYIYLYISFLRMLRISAIHVTKMFDISPQLIKLMRADVKSAIHKFQRKASRQLFFFFSFAFAFWGQDKQRHLQKRLRLAEVKKKTSRPFASVAGRKIYELSDTRIHLANNNKS